MDDYSNLDNLCKDRVLNTNEVFARNAFYGINKVLKNYTGLSNRYRLKFIIPHGITYDDLYLSDTELKSDLPLILSYPKYRTKYYRSCTRKIIFDSAAPFCYINKPSSSGFPRKGLIFFPAHSTHYVSASNDYEGIIRELDLLKPLYSPIVVCIYWKDYLEGHHIPFKKEGYKVISAGHIYDENFLYRLSDILFHFEYAASNAIGTSLFYSAFAGCKTFLLPHLSPDYEAESSILKRDHPQIPATIEQEITREFDISLVENDKSNSRIVKKYLNSDAKLSQSQMVFTILLSEILFRTIKFTKWIFNKYSEYRYRK